MCRIHEAASRFSKHQKKKQNKPKWNFIEHVTCREDAYHRDWETKQQQINNCTIESSSLLDVSITQLLINLTRRTQSSPHMRRCRCSFSPKTHLNDQLEQPDAYQRSLHNMHNHNHRRTCPRIYPSGIPSLWGGDRGIRRTIWKRNRNREVLTLAVKVSM